ncbi:APC family permease [Ferviditalea candida]|uniref:APC family permease n=1 Tax=Ferviditalea candida TaxID=3108399 RepID=A0ABU5ZHG6_9BACL|nr:APC family permease [Paenibacillaceae bacterium T2]
MGFSEFLGYDKKGEITELPTTLNKGRLGTKDVTMSALGFNAPAWVAASSMGILYSIVGHAAPLAIMIAYFFPMLVIAFTMIYLTRHAPSAAGAFTFTEKYIHPSVATVLGWSYVINCLAVAAMTAVIGAEYIQALIPGVSGVFSAKIIGTLMLLIFLAISLRGITITAKVAATFLIFEVGIVAGLGLLGILSPHVKDVSFSSLYSVTAAGGWAAVGPGVLFGLWMLANFDSTINFIEEAKRPVRTVQRSLLLVLSIAFIVYSLAAIGWQYAVPVDKLAAIVENGEGGPIAAVANEYLPSFLSWIAIFVVITSSAAGLQISMTSGARTAYRMSVEGHMPRAISITNKHKVPWLASLLIILVAAVLVWVKPLSELLWYYDVITIALVFNYIAIPLAFIFAMFKRYSFGKALAISILPMFAILVVGYIGYTAGANAWIVGTVIVISGIALIFYGKKGSGSNIQKKTGAA